MSESILYYPTIDIQDGAWLRSAALYWDEVCSIVPDQDYPDLSPELLYLEKRGYYRAIYPKDVFILGSPDEFTTAVMHTFAPFFPKRRHCRKIARTISLRRKTYNPEIATFIHYRKIPEDIVKVFTENDMVRVNENGWIEMDDFFAQRYIRLLAEFITKKDRKDMVLGTDKIARISEIYPEWPKKAKNSTAVSLILEKCLPIPAEDVTFEALLDFKEERKNELLSLQIKISELERKIAKAENIEAIKRELTEFRKSWELELIRTKKLYKEKKIHFKLGSFRSFIQDAGAVAGLLQWAQNYYLPNIPHTAFGASVGMAGLIGVGAYRLDYQNRIRSATNSSGFAYVVSAKKEGLLSNKNVVEVLN